MSTTIDERVVEMRFDANQFNNNIDTSIQSINKLNTSIDNMSTGKGLLNLSRAAEKVDFSKTEWAATHAGFHIQDVFEKATRFLENNIANRLVNFGTNIAKSLTIEPVFTGFNEYEQKMGSVQTIMNGANVSLEETMNTLEELNQYADKTIYSFGDMTNSIGKFVNAGVPLQDAVDAIKGISNEAAVSGATAVEAGRAMYNIAQALSTGSMKLIDWKSIENANMATMEFKKTLIETGAEMNAIQKGNGSSLSAEELLADPSKFRASIEGVKGNTWVTDKVMIEALKKYADETTEFGKKAYAAAQDVKTFTMLMDTLKEAAQSGWAVSMENVIGNFEEAKQMWTAVNNEVGGLLDKSADERNKLLEEWNKGGGRAALLNSVANVWFTLKDTIVGVKEAFRDVFPSITSKQLIGMTKGLEIFTQRIREFMADAKTMGTIKNIFSGFFKAINSIKSAIAQFWSAGKSIFGNITKAFTNVFSVTKEAEGISSIFVKMGNAIGTFGQKVNEFFTSSKNSENIVKIFEGIFSAVDLLRKGLVTLWNVASAVISPLLGGASGIGSALLEIAADIASFVTALNGGTEALSDFGSIAGKIKDIAVVVINAIKGIFDPSNISGDTFGKIKEIFTGLFDKFSLPKIDFNGLKVPEVVINSLTILKDTLSSVFNSLTKNLQTNDVLKPIFNLFIGLSNVTNGIIGVASSLLNAIKSIFDGFANMMNTAPFLTISMLFNNILNIINLLNTGFAMGSITQTFQKLAGILDNFGDAFEGWLNESLAKAAKNFAIAIAIVAAALIVLSTVEPDRLLTAVIALTAVAYGLRKAITGLSGIKFEGVESFKKSFSQLGTLTTVTTSVIKFAAAIAIVALAIKSIGSLDIDNLVASTLAIVVISAALVKVSNSLVKTASGMNKLEASNLKKIGFVIIEFAAGVRILASAIKVIGEMKLTDIVTGLVAIAIAMKGLTQVADKIGKINSSTIGKTAFALLTFSVAVRLIASAVNSIGQLGIEGVVAGLIGITVILSELAIAARILGESQASTKAAVVLLALAVSIGILGNAISKFGTMSEDQLTQGMYAIIVAVAAMLGIARLLPEEFNKSAVAMLACAVALNIVANAAEKFGNMKFTDMLQGILGLAAGMAIMAIGLRFMQGSISGAIAMIIVSAGLVIFAQALRMVGELSLAQIAKGIVGIAAGLIVLGVAMALMTGLIPGAIALLVASVGLIAISGALMMLSAIPFTSLLKALFGLAAAIAVFAVAAALCTPLLIPMAGLAIVLMLLAGTVAVVGAGLYLIAEAIAVLSTNGVAGVLLLKEFSIILLTLIPISLLGSVAITALSLALAGLTISLVAFGVSLVVVGAGLAVVGVGLIALAAGLSAIAVAAIMCVAAFAAITGNLDGLADVLGSFNVDFINAGKKLMTGFIDGIKSMASKAWDTLKNVGQTITSKFKSFFGIGDDDICQEAYDSGKAVGESYSKGLEDSQPTAESKAKEFSNDVSKEYENKLNEKTKQSQIDTEFSLTDGSKDSFANLTEGLDIKNLIGGETDLSSLISGDVDLKSMMNTDELNSSLLDTKSLTGDSAVNVDNISESSNITDSIMKDINEQTKDISENTDDISSNLGDVADMDFSNTEILSDANLEGLTDTKQLTELTKTKDTVDAISETVDEADNKTLKINVDTTDLEKAVKDIEKGLYGNGEERWIKLAELGFNAEQIAQIQNMVNEDFGSPYRHIAEDFNSYVESTKELVSAANEAAQNIVEAQKALNDAYEQGKSEEEIVKLRELYSKAVKEYNDEMFKKTGELAYKGFDHTKYFTNKNGEGDGIVSVDKYIENGRIRANKKTEKTKKIQSVSDFDSEIQKGKLLEEELQNLQNQLNRIIQSNAPESEKEAIRKRVSEMTRLWADTVKKESGNLSVEGFHSSFYANPEDDMGGVGRMDANDEKLREAQKARNNLLQKWQDILHSIGKDKTVFDRNEETLAQLKEIEREAERAKNSFNFTPGEVTNKKRLPNRNANTPLNGPQMISKEDYEEAGRDITNIQLMGGAKSTEKFKQALGEFFSPSAFWREFRKSFGYNVDLANSDIDELDKYVDSFINDTSTKLASGDLKTSAKGAYERISNALSNNNQGVEVKVNTDTTKVQTATKDVKTLTETSKEIKDKKITVSADASAATKAVMEFSNGLKKMSTAVDSETVKTKQVFIKFYTAIQQTINTYTPMIISNFKQTFVYAIKQTVSYLSSGEIIGQFRTIGINIGKGMADGIKSQLNNVKKAAKELSDAAAEASRKALKEHSPSLVFNEIGYFGGVAMAQGFSSTMGIVSEAASELGIVAANSTTEELQKSNPFDVMKNQLNMVKENLDMVGEEIQNQLSASNLSPHITPIVDMTDISENAGVIDSLFNQQQAANIAFDFDMSKTQQETHDQQMTEQMMLMNSHLDNLANQLLNQEPTPVDVNVNLEGDAKKFFTAMRDQNKDYFRRTGKYAFQ